MSIYEIERRLRMAAPDEPTVLPPLLLPVGLAGSAVSGPEIELRLGRGRRRMPVTVRLAWVAMLLLGIVAGALATGALRLEQLTGPLPVPGLYAANGIAIDYPATWSRITPPADPFGGTASIGLLASSHEVDGCDADSEAVARNTMPPQPEPSDGGIDLGYQQGTIHSLEDRQYACLIEQPMRPGETRLIVAHAVPQIIAVGPFGDFTASLLANATPGGEDFWLPSRANGFTESIDGMPARLVVADSVIPDAGEGRTWLIAGPGGDIIFVQVVLRGPDLDPMREASDEIARSLRFTNKPPPLTEADLDAALSMAIDARDREMRRYPGARFMGCLPRRVGEHAATIVDGPSGPLPEPAEVTCTTTAEATEVGLWRVLLTIAWPASGETPAGRWVREILVLGDGTAWSDRDVVPGTGAPLPFPGQASALPPRGLPATFAPGDLVRVLPPGGDAGFTNVESTRLPPESGRGWLTPPSGTYLVIVSGPERFDDRDWYIIDVGDEPVGWLAAEARGRPLLEAISAPDCPPSITSIEDLAYLPSITRRLCGGTGDLTFGPVQVGAVEEDGTSGRLAADPAWLAGGTTITLFGEGGPDGIDRGLPAMVAPSAGDLPRGTWITITGHFDDPAAAGCSWTYPAESGTPPEPAAVQARRCAERFVVTSFQPAGAP